MGEVALLLDTRLGRPVACKRLRPEFRGNSDRILRLLREAVLQGQLEHPAIVPVYDLALGEQGPQFVMRQVEGWSLAEVLRGEFDGDPALISQVRLLSGFTTICLAVDFAHQRGVRHRDIKPENIMLGGFGEVYLLDWGVARLDSEEESLRWEVRRISGNQTEFIGTPGYMAPEIVAGEGRPDLRADIYSLGAVLFEILTRQRLHDGDAAARLASTLQPATSPAQRDPAVPPPLDAICRKATARVPEERYRSARELADALSLYLDSLQGEQLRQQLAEEATHRGAVLLSAPHGSAEVRAEATREVTHALTLDPENARAAQLLEELLREVPEHFPEDAEEAFSREQDARRGSSRGLAVLRWLMPLLVALWVSVSGQNTVLRVLGGGLSLLAAAAAVAWARQKDPRRSILSASLFFGASQAVLLVAAGIFGPFLLVPVLRLLLGITMILDGYPHHRLVIVTSLLSLGLTYGIAVLGHSPLPELPYPSLLVEWRGAGHLYVALLQGGLLLASLLLIARFQTQQQRNERRLFWQAWQLRPRLRAG